jgi:hypothetical protein
MAVAATKTVAQKHAAWLAAKAAAEKADAQKKAMLLAITLIVLIVLLSKFWGEQKQLNCRPLGAGISSFNTFGTCR